MILRKKNNGLKHDPQIEISFVKKIDNTHTQKKPYFLLCISFWLIWKLIWTNCLAQSLVSQIICALVLYFECNIRIIQSCMFSFFSSFCCNCMVSKLICDSRSSLCIVHIIQSLIHCILPQIRRLFKNKVTIATKVKRTRDMM